MVMINNSGTNLTVVTDRKAKVLPPATAVEVFWPTDSRLFISKPGGASFRYDTYPPPRRWLNGHRVFVQVEADLSIFVVPSNTVKALPTLPKQPAHFPWLPQSTGP